MLTFFLAIIFGWWFLSSAKNYEGRNPKLWAAIGYFTFLAASSIAVWIISFTNLGLARSGPQSDLVKFAGAASIVLTAYAIGTGCTALVWRLFLRQPLADEEKAQVMWSVRERRTLAMPGSFPWLFALAYLTVGLLQIAIMTASIRLFLSGGNVPGGSASQLVQMFNIFVQSFGLALILWTCQRWFAIALWWATLAPFVAICHYVFTNVMSGFFYAPPLILFASQYVGALVAITIIVLAVYRWGAGVAILLNASLVSGLVSLAPLLLAVGSKIAPVQFAITFVSAIVGSLLLALVLYAGLLVHAESNFEARDVN